MAFLLSTLDQDEKSDGSIWFFLLGIVWHHEKFAGGFSHPWIDFINWTPVPGENIPGITMQAIGPWLLRSGA